jgi:hypothetical protein
LHETFGVPEPVLVETQDSIDGQPDEATLDMLATLDGDAVSGEE